MQKKILWGVAALVLLFVFAGCSQPTDYTFKAGKLDDPKIIRNDALVGLNLITWNPVINAQKYEVYRYDPVAKVNVKLTYDPAVGNVSTNIYYLDFVGWQNQLVNGREYEYTVVAISGTSTSVGEGAGAMPVQNGSAKAKIKANVPARNAFSETLSANLEGDLVLIDNKPNLKYNIAQVYGNNVINRVFAGDGTRVGTGGNNIEGPGYFFDPIRTAKLLTGMNGYYTVIVTATYGGYADYYTDIDIPAVEFKFDTPSSELWVNNLVATLDGDGESVVELKWDSNGNSFDVYRAELDTDRAGFQSSGAGWVPAAPGEITIKSDWALVNLTSGPDDKGGNAWEAKAGVPAINTLFAYAVVVKDGGVAVDSSIYSNTKATLAAPDDFKATLLHGTTDTALITWTADNGTKLGVGGTYRLHEKVTNDVAGTDVISERDIAVTPADVTSKYPFDAINIIIKDLTPNVYYHYDLFISKGGVEEASQENTQTFQTSGAVFEIVSVTADTTGRNLNANTIVVSVNAGSVKAPGAVSVELWRKVVGYATSLTTVQPLYSTEWIPLSGVTAFAKDDQNVTFTDNLSAVAATAQPVPFTLNAVYQYKARVNGVEKTSANINPIGWNQLTLPVSAVGATATAGAIAAISDVASFTAGTVVIGGPYALTPGATPPVNNVLNWDGIEFVITYELVNGNDSAPYTAKVRKVAGTASGTPSNTNYYFCIDLPAPAASPAQTDAQFTSGSITVVSYPWNANVTGVTMTF